MNGSILSSATIIWIADLQELGASPAAAKKSADSELSSPREFLQLRRSAFRLLHRSWDTYEIPFETLELHEEIGRGAFSVVHRAHVWVGKVRETVAVKMLKDLPTSEERRNLQREIELLKLVGKHANVVSMRAYCTMGPRLALVVEYCPLGDLRTYLLRTRARLGKEAHDYGSDSGDLGLLSVSTTSTDSGIPEDLGEVPSLLHLLSLARQVAQGMDFLASKRVVHRDLAARNVLLVTEQHAKIADLGLSRDMYEEGLYRKQGAGRLPARWMALESLSHMTYTTLSDVWSFGVLMWEVASLGAVPYPGVANHQLLDFLTTGHRLEKPANCPQETYDLMTSCWNAIPICRPTFSAIVSKLDEILEQSQGYFNFNSESE
ncbi:tyrosine-protein kinase receptor torso [Dermacentor silvarum]|uniref:tyrosine-protein kinase receptor torso n=1 Tax=Dermacentor silvarum TaxID=543639 RepID=UPI0021011F15|nr:tyrosine-protein kinase receptor torso [Dermacentor silvarum]